MKRQQSGFTMIEVSVAVAIGVVILVGATTFYIQARESANIESAVENAQKIARAADRYRKRVTSSAINPYAGTYVPATYTFQADLTDATVATLNSATALNLPTSTAFGTDYRVTTSATGAHVDFQIPVAGLSPPGARVVATAAGSTTLRVGVQPLAQGRLQARARAIKRNVYGEVTR